MKQLWEVKDRLMGEVDEMARRLMQEHAEQEEVEERLGRTLADVAAQIELLCGVYRRASGALPTIGLAPYHHRADFDDWRLADLVLFFRHLSKQLTRSARPWGIGWTERVCVLASRWPRASSSDFIIAIPSSWWTASWTSWRRWSAGGRCGPWHPSIAVVVQLEKERDFGGI